jgi:hypothetical protein
MEEHTLAVPPGRLVVALMTEAGDRFERSVELEAGEETLLRFDGTR